MGFKSEHDTRLYSSRGIKIWLKFIEKNYPYLDIDSILKYSNMEKYEVDDQAHWFTQDQIDLFYEKVVQLTGNQNIAREAGRFAAVSDAGGTLVPFALSLLGPAKVYALIGKTASNITKSCDYEYEKLSKNEIKITVKPKPEVDEKPYQCENRVGYFEAIALAFKGEIPKIDHPKCMFKGSSFCEYIVSWKRLPLTYIDRIKKSILFFFFVINLFFIFYNFTYALTIVFPASSFLTILSFYFFKLLENKHLNSIIDNVRSTTEQYKESIESNYNNALFINEIGIVLSKQMNIDDILSKVIDILERRLDYDRGMIVLANEDKTKLVFKAGFGYSNEVKNMLQNAFFNIDKTDSRATFVSSFHEQQPYIIQDVNEIKDQITSHSFEFAKKMGAKSFICVPIVFENESIGLLVVDNKDSKRPLLQSDVNLLMGITPQIGISIKNANLIKSKLEQFNSILFVLAASIDARDFLTAGHSEKVMEFSIGICNELGLSKEYTEMIRVAALLHDYGKIGVPDAILKKSGKLSSDEYQEIQTHAAKTRTILERISFEGIYTQIPEIAGCHHEKLDGSGYPKGLRGDGIPLGARIIAVADFFEAITAKRHYREPMQVDEAIALLKKEGSSRLDPDIIEAFINYYNYTNRL